MKKVIAAAVMLVMLVGLVGCNGDAAIYKEATNALAMGEYDRVITLLDSIPDFEDKDGLRGQAATGLLQKTAEEYVIEIVENAGYYVPTSMKVLKSGYNSAMNGDKYATTFEATGIYYFTIQAGTKGGGNTTGDITIVYGGDMDKEIMKNDDPGNDYAAYEASLDVKAINQAIQQYWVDLGVVDEAETKPTA